MMASGNNVKGLLHFAASQGDVQEVLRLLNQGADVNERNYDRRTPLHAAAANGHLGVLEVLCNKGADPSLIDRWGRTPADEAATGNHTAAQEFLLQRAPPGSPNRKARLMKQVSFNQLDPNSPMAKLLDACATGNVRAATVILSDKIVDVNDCDDDRRTPLHLAASEGHLSVVTLLVERGANMNAKDRMGNRPLNDALRGNHTACVDYLAKKGAVAAGDPNQMQSAAEAQSPKVIPLRYVSKDALAELHERGVREFWSWDASDIEMEKSSFAHGTGGEVYRCRFRNMDCVAKTLGSLQSQQNLTDLSNEILLMASVRHPHIVTFFGACFQSPEPVMILEYCAGGNLESRIIRAHLQDHQHRIRLSDAQRVKYAHQISQAMTFLHRFHIPIIHRDLKPANVLLTATDDVKITDFGLAKFLPKGSPPARANRPASTKSTMNDRERADTNGDAYVMTGETGSYRFMAPEVYLHAPYDRSVDVYAYSMILYWLFSGIRPFCEHKDGGEAVKEACRGIRPDLVHVKEQQIAEICAQGWSQNPEDRPTFSDIADKLEICRVKGFTHGRPKSSRFATFITKLSGAGADTEESKTTSEHSEDKTAHSTKSTKSKSILKRKSMFGGLFSS